MVDDFMARVWLILLGESVMAHIKLADPMSFLSA